MIDEANDIETLYAIFDILQERADRAIWHALNMPY